MGPIDSLRRLAIVLRICVRAMSVKPPGLVARDAGLGARDAAPSRSRLMMRPPGPEPCTEARSSPCSRAMRRARGDERRGPSLAALAACCTGAGAGLAEGAEAAGWALGAGGEA